MAPKSFFNRLYVLRFLIIAFSALYVRSTNGLEVPKQIDLPLKNIHLENRNRNTIDEAIKYWQNLATQYQQQNKIVQEIKTRFKIVQGYIERDDLGLAKEELNLIINLSPSPQDTALAWSKKANISWIEGNNSQAIKNFQKSLKFQKTIPTLNNLVNVLLERRENHSFSAQYARESKLALALEKKATRDKALAHKYLNLALSIGEESSTLSSLKTKIILHQQFNQDLSEAQIAQAAETIGNLPPSRNLIYTLIDWAKIDDLNKESWLKKAEYIAKSIQDDYASSYVKIELSNYFLSRGDLVKAKAAINKSLSIAQDLFNYDAIFRSRSILAKIYILEGNNKQGLNHYLASISALDALILQDADYVQTSKLVDFKTDLEPIYRNTLALLLDGEEDPGKLNNAILINNKLRLAQLRQFFKDNCFETPDLPTATNISDDLFPPQNHTTNSTIIYSIVLEDKSHFLLQSPDGRIKHTTKYINSNSLNQLASQWYDELQLQHTWSFWDKSKKLYDLIIRPFDTELEKINPEEIIFIHDGILRSLPMAALFDGEKFLAEKWASSSSIGYGFTEHPEKDIDPEVLGFSLQNHPDWPTLANANEEVDLIKKQIGGKTFSNEEFTFDNLYKQVKDRNYSILHIATHGYFSGDESTSYILANDGKISALQLEDILKQSQQRIALLVLSACDTGIGNDLSILGLAGIASRSGVDSVVGSFWQVGDEQQLDMISSFYSFLAEGKMSNAEAIQKSQIEQITLLAHPHKWAALNLITSN